jgi:endonuclease/exonuclease/phosphatase family metal-dependent hydrolase
VTIGSSNYHRFTYTSLRQGFVARGLAAILAVGLVGCASRRHSASEFQPQTCREVAPDPEPSLVWITPTAARDRYPLAKWCATVGPILYHSRPLSDVPVTVDRLAIVTWNVHVGGGDVGELIRRLEAGEYTSGERIEHFVLLLQEAYRRDGGVPARLAAGLPVPARIGSRNAKERRADIDRIVGEQRLAVLYVPSMRNGADPAAPEDRGNAIVSTLPLLSPSVIELPFERQRRAAVAVVEGRTQSGTGWRLRVADAHFDTALALTRGGPLAARRRQASALVDALATAPEDTVLGGDLNTWLGSTEPALKTLRRAFPDGVDRTGTTWRGPLGVHAKLDHLLARGRARLRHVARLPDRLGSDHYPVLGIVEF